jgi:5,10-methylenetetrahydrofolate reductase
LIKGISEGEIQKLDDHEEANVNTAFAITGDVPKGYKKVIEPTIWMSSDVLVDLP